MSCHQEGMRSVLSESLLGEEGWRWALYSQYLLSTLPDHNFLIWSPNDLKLGSNRRIFSRALRWCAQMWEIRAFGPFSTPFSVALLAPPHPYKLSTQQGCIRHTKRHCREVPSTQGYCRDGVVCIGGVRGWGYLVVWRLARSRTPRRHQEHVWLTFQTHAFGFWRPYKKIRPHIKNPLVSGQHMYCKFKGNGWACHKLPMGASKAAPLGQIRWVGSGWVSWVGLLHLQNIMKCQAKPAKGTVCTCRSCMKDAMAIWLPQGHAHTVIWVWTVFVQGCSPNKCQ
jgi:hypothetical protein